MSNLVGNLEDRFCRDKANLSLQHNRFVLETKEKEPEIVFIGDSLIQQIANTEVRQKVGFQVTGSNRLLVYFIFQTYKVSL